MLTVALHTLRTRWITFTGSFVALSLGVALIAVMGLALASSLQAPERRPERFAAAPVVVQGRDTLRVPTPNGDRTQPLAQPNAVPARTIAALKRLGPVTEDRSFAVRAENGPADLVGHPWPTAAFAPYGPVNGREPRADGEVVVTSGWAVKGDRLRTGSGTVTVVGVVRGLGFENAVFLTPARAAQLAPVSTQLVVEADAAAVREAVGTDSGAEVLTGADRRFADADPDRDREALTAMNAMFGTAGGVSGFVSVFVVASTFAFAVAQRRREFGLLRTAGATPGQIRRTVLAEALLIGVLASAAGCALGAFTAPYLAAWVVDGGLAPAWFTIGDHVWPYLLAFWTGLFVALTGAAAAAWRAGRTGPAQALREASVDQGTMPWTRRLLGTALLATAAVMLLLALATDPSDLLHRKTYVSRPMLLITAFALLAPLLVRPLTRLLTWLPSRLPGACGLLIRENTSTAVRRTAATAAPVLVTVALTGSLPGATATLNEARTTETRHRTIADFVVTPPPGGYDRPTLERLQKIPNAKVSSTSPSEVHVLEEGVALIRSPARVADPKALTATTRLPLTAGRVLDLDDDSIIVNEEWERHTVGQRVTVWLADGTRKSLRIAAVMPVGTGDNGVYVTPANAPHARVDRIDVKVTPGTDTAAAARALRAAIEPHGGLLHTRTAWLRATQPPADGTTRLGFLLVLGIALLYTGISLANTLVMATPDRVRDLRALRLAGATTAQVLRLIAAEALTVVAVGALLGLLVAALNLLGMWGALSLLSVHAPIVLPWKALGSATAACAALAVVAAVIPAASALRGRAGIRTA
ncbi:ABC transporter integral membrane protein [Streptomyces davaonensis JCM 4913]|uniref:ABC transporter integral membrane protein n=1 Tax=Streptomyces davaonensis (strain DSM 101723 / JCM 4913 / KCC S-0913 / 768) TaxID=1214101 RepID=K4QZJ8_STRDJ|nr:ABC transporter permease [Streptomyces davaonensis]CCK29471.1 ABC transporter integral membrane protein [Streptomyces davaonensis JCM 4913]